MYHCTIGYQHTPSYTIIGYHHRALSSCTIVVYHHRAPSSCTPSRTSSSSSCTIIVHHHSLYFSCTIIMYHRVPSSCMRPCSPPGEVEPMPLHPAPGMRITHTMLSSRRHSAHHALHMHCTCTDLLNHALSTMCCPMHGSAQLWRGMKEVPRGLCCADTDSNKPSTGCCDQSNSVPNTTSARYCVSGTCSPASALASWGASAST